MAARAVAHPDLACFSLDRVLRVARIEAGHGTREGDDEEAEEAEPGGELTTTGSGSRELTVATAETEKLDRTDDPVRMYLREMGSVELLSREGEIAIAKRIEAGREAMIGGICESPLTFDAILAWRDALLDGRILLRDIIDLDATYGAGPEADDAEAEGDDEAEPAEAKEDRPEGEAEEAWLGAAQDVGWGEVEAINADLAATLRACLTE